MEKKKWWKSITLWVNVAVIILEALNQILQLVPVPAGVTTYVVTGLNILLRFKTKMGII